MVVQRRQKSHIRGVQDKRLPMFETAIVTTLSSIQNLRYSEQNTCIICQIPFSKHKTVDNKVC